LRLLRFSGKYPVIYSLTSSQDAHNDNLPRRQPKGYNLSSFELRFS